MRPSEVSSASSAQIQNEVLIREEVPLVKADTALLSLRSSGHDFSSAIGEVIDNSLEAGANAIRIRTFAIKKKIGNNTRATEVIERVAVGDDGEGMPIDIHHKCLQMGYSSRYNSRLGMGRFGVGAKLGGISQAQRIEVYTRQTPEESWRKTYIDLEEIKDGQDVIPIPTDAELPEDCRDLVGADRGTLIIWSKTDHLQQRESGGAIQASRLESELINYVSRTFRKFLDGGKRIHVNVIDVLPHDPLYRMQSTRFHHIPEKTTVKVPDYPVGLKIPKVVADRIFYDAKAKTLTYRGNMPEQHQNVLLTLPDQEVFIEAVEGQLGRKPNGDELQDIAEKFRYAIAELAERSNPDPIATILHQDSFEWPIPNTAGQTSPVEVTVTLLPDEFWEREKFSDRPGGSSGAKERRIDENEGISILRAGREIFYGYLRDVQPPVKEIDRFVGVEIRFRPDLDECFHVRNVKRGAEPIEGLRDRLAKEIHNTILTARKSMASRHAGLRAKDQQDSGINAEAQRVVEIAKDISPQPRAGADIDPAERRKKVEEAAEVVTREEPHKRKQVADSMMTRRVNLIPQSWPGNDFIQVEHLGTTAIVRLNTQHPFYTDVYSKLVNASGEGVDPATSELARSAQVALDLLILSYAQAEAVEKDADAKYGNLRSFWGTILKNNIQAWSRS